MGAFYVLAFLALLFKAYVPTGFMVGDGGTVLICTGMGPMTTSVRPYELPPAPDKHKADHACPFAGNAAPPLAPPIGPAIAGPMMLERPAAAITAGMLLEGGLASPLPPSTGPPPHLT